MLHMHMGCSQRIASQAVCRPRVHRSAAATHLADCVGARAAAAGCKLRSDIVLICSGGLFARSTTSGSESESDPRYSMPGINDASENYVSCDNVQIASAASGFRVGRWVMGAFIQALIQAGSSFANGAVSRERASPPQVCPTCVALICKCGLH